MKLVQFGAGNIGRSFIAQIFSRSGWEVVFVDVDKNLIQHLNEKQYYTVVIKREGQADEIRRIGKVRAVDGQDTEAAAAEIAGAEIAGISVGKNALPKALPVIAKGLAVRFGLKNGQAAAGGKFLAGRPLTGRPLDILIAENDREAPALFRSVLSATLGTEFPLETLVGLVETSIGKMVPIMKAADLALDPLLVYAEEYETLIVDKTGFRSFVPKIPAILPVDPIAAYVDRKLFIHNLGHAAAAYLGYAAAKSRKETIITIPQALALPNIEKSVRKAMHEAADALVKEYPQSQYSGSYTREELSSHIEDLICRFKNKALGDTVHRVGRDLRRKLAREDRITGAMLLCAKHSLSCKGIAEVYRAAPEFFAPAEDGSLFPADKEFRTVYGLDSCSLESQSNNSQGNDPHPSRAAIQRILRDVSGLDSSRKNDSFVITTILS